MIARGQHRTDRGQVRKASSSFGPQTLKTRGRSPATARVHLLYVWILQHTTPHQQTAFKIAQLAQAIGASERTVRNYLATVKATKPWLRIQPAGRAGIYVFWAPEAALVKKSATHFPPRTPYKYKRPINDPKGDRTAKNPTPTDTWMRRRIMAHWRRKSYSDPSMKWASRNGADLVRIIGTIVWRAKLTIDQVRLAVKRFWNEFLYAEKPLPAGGKALFQCLYMRAFCAVLSVCSAKSIS